MAEMGCEERWGLALKAVSEQSEAVHWRQLGSLSVANKSQDPTWAPLVTEIPPSEAGVPVLGGGKHTLKWNRAN